MAVVCIRELRGSDFVGYDRVLNVEKGLSSTRNLTYDQLLTFAFLPEQGGSLGAIIQYVLSIRPMISSKEYCIAPVVLDDYGYSIGKSIARFNYRKPFLRRKPQIW